MEALTRPFGERLRLDSPVDAVTRHRDYVLVRPRGAEAMHFDEVVLATHSDQALALLRDASSHSRISISTSSPGCFTAACSPGGRGWFAFVAGTTWAIRP